jgi:hypothetical protein
MSDLFQIIPKTYWEEFQIIDSDLEFLFNRLLEVEEPQTVEQLFNHLILNRIHLAKDAFNLKKNQESLVYKPKEAYSVGQILSFPAMQWKKGKITEVRPGFNPQLSKFSVLEVEFENRDIYHFAADLENHKLNDVVEFRDGDFEADIQTIIEDYGTLITYNLFEALETDPDLVRIAGCWFPKSLLIDINQGQLNLAEAILEEVNGGPLPTQNLIDQIEIPPDVNKRLLEFSMNYALQEDNRFDEVGPTGKTLWYLQRLEPEWVQNIPSFLNSGKVDFNPEECQPALQELESIVEDELSSFQPSPIDLDEIDISLIFPHWRSGTLPLSSNIASFFPTADEAPRIRFVFVDSNSNQPFPGWVVRPPKYVFGLKEWYEEHGLMPGSIIKLIRSKIPGEIRIHVEKRRQNKEWVRTALIGADGGIVFAMLKQIVTATFDERMAIAVPDSDAVDGLWKKQRPNAETSISIMVQELAKLNPQGHVHAQELYACVNLIRRSAPGFVINSLLNNSKYVSLGNLYFRLDDGHSDASND